MNQIDLRHFDLNLLVVFDVLMTERNVTRAAERLGRTQSAVSHSLSRLREQFGDPLLTKGGARMQPTALALDLVEQARPMLSGIRASSARTPAAFPSRACASTRKRWLRYIASRSPRSCARTPSNSSPFPKAIGALSASTSTEAPFTHQRAP